MVDNDKVLKAKICLVGDSEVGKTSLIRRFVHDEFDDDYISTLGAKITKKQLRLDFGNGEYEIHMTVWDIMGDKRVTDLLKDSYFDGAGGIMAVCDLTRKDTFGSLDEWITAGNSIIEPVPMTFVGNKLDLANQKSIEGGDLSKYAKSHNSPYFLTSAKTGENVNAVFLDIARRVLLRSYQS